MTAGRRSPLPRRGSRPSAWSPFIDGGHPERVLIPAVTAPRALIRKPVVTWAILLAGLGLLLGLALRATVQEVRTPTPLAQVPYEGSASCKTCHPDHFQSWRRTFHRTMTQNASPTSVLGDFSGVAFTYKGITSRFLRDGERYVIETIDGNGLPRRYPVERTVGSRRVQQYVAREGDRHIRLPLAWNIEEKRWFHLNGGFLDPDGADFNQHRALWDANCIFCHNVKAKPGYNWELSRFDSHVEELGIACEACHGPGEEHVERNSNPLRRYYLRYADKEDLTIVDPMRLDKARRVQICGHCHGQRLPNPVDRIRQFLSEGDPYTAGDDLSAYTTPIHADTKLQGVDLSLRFWKDGTPRLTAYEYQGLTMSKDYQRGDLTCTHCHSMHAGDPRGMITEEKRGPAACQGCHADLVARAAEHSRHNEGGGGTDCYACHMPKIAYGLMDVHPSHRIQKPDPSRAWRHDMPEACTLCHTDKTARWAAEAMARQYGKPPPPDLPTDPAFDVAENLRALVSGDVVQRSVAVMALGDERGATKNPMARLWAVPFLLITMQDEYPAVRHFAFRALRKLLDRASATRPALAGSTAPLPRFEPQATAEERQRVLERWWVWWVQLDKGDIPRPDKAVPLDAALQPLPDVLQMLRDRRPAQQSISIGE